MKLSRSKVILALSLTFATALRADLVTLKDGKTLEGTILEQTPEGVKMKYRVTPKIWDEKVIPMAEIAPSGIVKEKPEEIEIKELRKLVPTPDLMTAEKYEQIIQDRLRPFVNRYPGTKEADEIQKMIDDIQAEKEKVVSGGTKLEGKWLDPTEARAEKYNIEAYRIRQSMNEKAAAGDLSGAMREFDAMLDKKQFHFASIYFPMAIEEAKAHLVKLDAKTAQMIKDQPVLQKMRDDSLKRLVEPDLSRSKAAIDKEVNDAATRYEVEKKETKWITPYKYDLKALQALAKQVVATKLQLEKYDISTLKTINDQVAVTTRLYYADKIEEGWKELGVLATLARGNPEYSSLIQTYQSGFQKKHNELSAKNAATQNPLLNGGSSAVTGTGTPGTDDAVARALAMAASGQAGVPPQAGVPQGGVPQPTGVPPQGVAPQPGVPQQMPGAVPNPYQQSGAVQPGANPYGQPPQGAPGGAVAPNPYAQPQAGEMPPPVEEGAMSMNQILMIAGGVVLLILLLAVALNGKKK